jgi:alkaline phosphatase D
LLKTSQYIQWDDREVSNNWYPGEVLTDAYYKGIAANALAEQGHQVLFEYNPIEGKLIYRKFQRGSAE